MADFEAARDRLRTLILLESQSEPGNRNEATTRLHLIDQLLFNSLGWDARDCVNEERFENKYTDYVLGASRNVIWEAKREGIYFEVPVGFKKRICKLKTVADLNPHIASAIRQALEYCQSRGVGIGVVSNGHQVIAFLASRQDGVPPMEGDCLVFASLQEMADDFLTFWNNLSNLGIQSNYIYRTLQTSSLLAPPEKLSVRIGSYPGFKNRNPFQADLKILGDLFIEDIGKIPQNEEEFLKSCYSPSGALSQYALISKQLLEARYSIALQKQLELSSTENVRDKAGLSKELQADILAAGISRRPIILLGDVGVGKTIFLRHLIKVDAREILSKGLVVYIDFGKEPALTADLRDFIVKRSVAILREEYRIDLEERNFVRGVYRGDLERFSKSSAADLKELDPVGYRRREVEMLEEKTKERASHLRAALTHISKGGLGEKKQIVIILDNIDQRPVQFQEEVFLIAQSLAETWPATVFLSLRPDTFYQSKVKGSASAYQPRVFTVAPPRIDKVIEKRFEYALDQLKEHNRLSSFPEGLRLDSKSLVAYISALLSSFRNSQSLMEFIDNLSGGNVRQALEFIGAFVGSGHVNATKILQLTADGNYTIPVHEFMRAVIYGDHEYFDPSISPICNLFDISIQDGREHFLLLNLLAYVQRSGTDAEGFVAATELFRFGHTLGFHPGQINFGLERAVSKKLLESNPKFSDEVSHLAYRITTIGAYTIHRLVLMFSYLDAVVVDTPIVDPTVRAQIGVVVDVGARLQRARIFLAYLNFQWKQLAHLATAVDWAEIAEAISQEIAHIEKGQQFTRESRVKPKLP
jgi:hypothetical protein